MKQVFVELNTTQEEMIQEFMCPGCVSGTDPKSCENYRPDGEGDWHTCSGHCAGTTILPIVGRILLGLPKGFNRLGPFREALDDRQTRIRLWQDPSKHFPYDKFNVAVWTMEKDGYLFVRVYMPRINYPIIDVIKGGTIAKICPNAINVAEFIDEID